MGSDCRATPEPSLPSDTRNLCSCRQWRAPADLVEKAWDLTRICLAAQEAGGHGVLARVDRCKDASQGPQGVFAMKESVKT